MTKSKMQAAAFTGLLAMVGCHAAVDEGTTSDEVSGKRVAWANGEWTGRKAWYRTSQGSFLVDAELFLALERAESDAPFASPASLEPLGFLYPPAGETDLVDDPRLPLGVVRDTKPGAARADVGFTCAACHTGVVETPTTRLLVDGGQSFLDLTKFLVTLRGALAASDAPGPKQDRLCARLGKADCKERIAAAHERVIGLVERNREGEEGPGRVDALTREANEIFAHQLASEPTYALAAPISIPFVWDAPKLSCLQTNCLPLDPLARNVAEQIAVFGETRAHREGKRIVTEGTVEMENLYRLESALGSMPSPRWDERALRPLDQAKIARGASVYAAECAGCHTEPYRADAPASAFVVEEAFGKTQRVWAATSSLPREVATDSAFVDVHTSRFVSDPLLIDIFNRKLWNVAAATLGVDPDGALSGIVIGPAVLAAKAGLAAKGFYDWRGNPLELATYGALGDAVIDDELARMEPDPAKRAALRERYVFGRKPAGGATDLAKYKARPLDGIAFTAPFGHNGAWPTLEAVLTPPAERPRTFVIRPGSFDVTRIGLDTTAARAGDHVFDTSAPGNGAGGHAYGTGLPRTDKDALLEYLASL